MNNKITENIVISSRIRLARNVEGIPFQSKLYDIDLANSITKGMYEVLENVGEFNFYRLRNLDSNKCLTLLEKHFISKELIDNKDISAVAINSEENIIIMINEEDHIREQCVLKGFSLKEAYSKLTLVDDEIINNMDISFSKDLGFLTTCPSNLGTGLRASVMLFLPALTMSGKMKEVIQKVSNFGLTVRGIYGEGSKAEGYMYQISNSISLGLSEMEIINNVSNFVLKICEMEDEARGFLLETEYDNLKDKVLRAYGILTNCYKISTEEFFKLISELRLGYSLGLISLNNEEIIDEIMISAQPANLIELSGKKMEAYELDIYRAAYIGRVLKNIRLG